MRFLRARKFDLDKSLTLLDQCCAQFDKYEAEKCADMGAEIAAVCDPDVLVTFYPHTQAGYDKKKRVLQWEANGCVNLDALMTVVRRANLVRYHFWTMQKRMNDLFIAAPELEESGTKNVCTTCVLDFDGLSMHHMSTKMFSHLKTMVAIDNVCYPEMLGKLIVVNAPSLASLGWKTVKGWLDPRTQEKIEICPRGEKSASRLLELIDAHSVPKSMGGTGDEVLMVKPNTEYFAVPRGGTLISRGVFVPAGKTATVDTYVRDSMVFVTVSAYEVAADYKHSFADQTFPEGQPAIVHAEVNATTDTKDEAGRLLQKVEASEKDRVIKVTFRNTSGWYQRWIVTALTVYDEDGVPTYKKDGSALKGPLRLVPAGSDGAGATADGGSGDVEGMVTEPESVFRGPGATQDEPDA